MLVHRSKGCGLIDPRQLHSLDFSSLDFSSLDMETWSGLDISGHALRLESEAPYHVPTLNPPDHCRYNCSRVSALLRDFLGNGPTIPYLPIIDNVILFGLWNGPVSRWDFKHATHSAQCPSSRSSRTRSASASSGNDTELCESIKHRDGFSSRIWRVCWHIGSLCYHTNVHKDMCDEEVGAGWL